MSRITLEAKNFRVFPYLRWSPEGVCLLTGANGTGKTTVLAALNFLVTLFHFGHEVAFSTTTSVNFRRIGAPPEDPVEFTVTLGDLIWTLQFPMSAEVLKGPYGEELRRGDQVIFHTAMFAESWTLGAERMALDDTRCCLRVLWDRGEAPWLRPLVDVLTDIRVHFDYALNQVQRIEPVIGRNSVLHQAGKNLWSVLANWKGAPMKYQGQYDWVVAEARRAFPGVFGSMEFDRGIPYVFGPDAKDASEGLPPSLLGEGLIVGLLHLTAVAGARKGAILAFDAMESQLHPHAIRSILHAMRQRADDLDLTILLTTHSPVLMNAFQEHLEKLYVLRQDRPGQPLYSTQPKALSELIGADALAQTTPGELYDWGEFGRPDSSGEL
jgi:energy-coupling factor transporter ATP-binding protein EcfA2